MRKYRVILSLSVVVVALVAGFYFIRHAPKDRTETKLVVVMPTQPDRKADTSVSIPADALDQTIDELAQAKLGLTAGEWRGLHPLDQTGDSGWFGGSCAEFSRTVTMAEGIKLTRIAVFYLPDPPQSRELPAEDQGARLVDGCMLGVIRTEIATRGRNVYASLPAVKAALAAKFGTPVERNVDSLRALGPVWQSGGSTIAIENPAPVTADIAKFLQTTTAPLRLYAYLPRFDVEQHEQPDNRYLGVSPSTSPEIFALALHTSGADQELQNAMSSLYQDCLKSPRLTANTAYYEENRTTPGLVRARKVVDTLQRWLHSTANFPPQRKASALLAAHFLLGVAYERLDKSEQDAMDGWLATSGLIPNGSGSRPSRHDARWLQEARQLDPDGPIGETIWLLTLIPWQTPQLVPGEYSESQRQADDASLVLPAEHDGQKDFTDYVIETGQKYLSQPHDPIRTEEVEYLVGAAYCDRVEVARTGVPGDKNKVTHWQTERAAAAKPEALRHLRAAVATRSTRSIAAWRKGWRLIAGLPVGFRFYDFGD
jgi:hypothetical protein